MRTITAKFNSNCRECGRPIRAGEECLYDSEEKKTYHRECVPEEETPGPQSHTLADQLGFIRPGDPIPESWIHGKPTPKTLF